MFTPIGKPRALPYPLYYQVSNGNTVPDVGLSVGDFIWPEDPEERTVLPLWVSQHEFTAILSSVDVGADIAYPDQWVEVYYILVRNLRYKVPICDLIIDCITNNPATLQAIIDALAGSDEFNTFISEKVKGLTGGQITGELVAGSCDNSVLAGKMIALVAALNTNNTDALEIIEVGTNDEEKVAAILEGIPVAGELPFGDILEFMQDMLEDFGENYDAASTIERRDNLARDLYCFAKDKEGCAVTYANLFDFFNERVSSGLTLESLIQNLVDWIVTGDFTTDQLVFDAMFFIQIASIRMGKEFFGVNMPKIGALTRDALPSSAWEDWDECDPIPPDEECEDLTLSAWTWTAAPDSAYGTWTSGQGLGPTFAGGATWLFSWAILAAASPTGLCTRIRLIFNEPCVNFIVYTSAGSYGPVSGLSEIDIDEADAPVMFPINLDTTYVGITATGNVVASTFRVEMSCLYIE